MFDDDAQKQKNYALVFLGIFAATMLFIVILPFWQTLSLYSEMNSQGERITNYERQLKRIQILQVESEKLAQAGKNAKFLLEGQTTGVAGANLQKFIANLVRRNGGQTTSLQVLPPVSQGRLTQIPMDLTLKVNIKGLQNILFSIEAGMPLVFVDNIIVRSSSVNRTASNQSPVLEVSMKLSGYFASQGQV